MRLLVSACLMGLSTRYDGKDSLCEEVLELSRKHILIPVCPEQLGGLPTPRPPCEIKCGRVMSRDGRDLTASYEKGAEQAMAVYSLCGCEAAVLKQNSPSCGKVTVYDGSFFGILAPGPGLFARKLLNAGIRVFGEDEIKTIE